MLHAACGISPKGKRAYRHNIELPKPPMRFPGVPDVPSNQGASVAAEPLTQTVALAEASGSRTHRDTNVPHAGFEDQAQHRPRLASFEILASG